MLATERTYLHAPESPVDAQRTSAHHPAPRQRPNRDPIGRTSLFVCIGAVMAVMWFLAVQGAAIFSLNYRIAALKSQVATLSAVNASLTAQADTLAQPSRILNVALNRLHMHYATPIQIPASGEASAR